MIQEQLRIAGQKVACDRHIEVFNPFTHAVVGTVPKASHASKSRPPASWPIAPLRRR